MVCGAYLGGRGIRIAELSVGRHGSTQHWSSLRHYASFRSSHNVHRRAGFGETKTLKHTRHSLWGEPPTKQQGPRPRVPLTVARATRLALLWWATAERSGERLPPPKPITPPGGKRRDRETRSANHAAHHALGAAGACQPTTRPRPSVSGHAQRTRPRAPRCRYANEILITIINKGTNFVCRMRIEVYCVRRRTYKCTF